ncbi:MAG TPA: glycoside hydrolase family 3 N-terminal domain-containing protein [Polyangiaceae bacterium]|nr:glycoside hydrolase family 3 N-terminal domain-containing protein [Polyangiaceae bacterium]
MSTKFISCIAAMLALSVSGSVWATGRAEYRAAVQVPIYMGGESSAFRGVARSRLPGALNVSEVPADVGWVRDIDPAFRTDAQPLGAARVLEWSGRGSASYAFVSQPGPLSEVSTPAGESFLIFNLKQLGTSAGNLRITLETGSCRLQYALTERELPQTGFWQTYRIPLEAFQAQGACKKVKALGSLSVVFEKAPRQAGRVGLAALRWENYPKGWSFSESLTEDLLQGLSVEDKIGQMAQLVHRAGVQNTPVLPADVTRLRLGSLFGDSGAPPHDANGELLADTPANWVSLLNSYQRAALATEQAIPILFGTDAVHGVSLVPGATIFPHNIGLGAAGNPELVEAIARATAEEAAAIGFRSTFAPTLAVARDERWGRTYESFAETPELVSRLGVAAIRGYQGTRTAKQRTPLSHPLSVLATAKHFGGDGAGEFVDPASWCSTQPCPNGYSTDRQDNALSREQLIRLHLSPYVPAIAAGVGMVMSSDSRFHGDVVTGNHDLLTNLLKNDWGFQGVVITDYGSWSLLDPQNPERSALLSLNAGNDLFMLPQEVGYPALAQAVVNGLATGELSSSRVDDAVRRILRQKFELGLFDLPFVQSAAAPLVGSAEHRALAREAVQESLVLLQNRKDRFGGPPVLPLRKKAKMYVAGKAADDIGIQSGGWTDVWQGVVGNDLPGTSILEAITEQAQGQVMHSPDASADTTGYDVGVVVVGEYPYAEFCGDVLGKTFFCEFSRANPAGLVRAIPEIPLPFGLPPPQSLQLGTSSFTYFSPFAGPEVPIPVTVDPVSDLEVVTRVCSKMPCVVVLVSGRPMFIEPALEQSDAFVAAWLPGSEGGGVADVLFGRNGSNFTGKLRHTWPRTPRSAANPSQVSSQPEHDYVPQNVYVSGMGDLNHVLFPVGYGLRY